jgi:putative spermidine/putrescine transport system ATP-binding protein
MLEGTLDDGAIHVPGARIELAGRSAGRGPCTLALRPERLSLGPAGAVGPGCMPAVVELASYLGPVREHLVHVGQDLRAIVRDTTAQPGALLAAGEPVTVHWDAGAERVFDAAGSPLTSAFVETTPARISDHA